MQHDFKKRRINVPQQAITREGEAPAEPKGMTIQKIQAAHEDVRPPLPSMILLQDTSGRKFISDAVSRLGFVSKHLRPWPHDNSL